MPEVPQSLMRLNLSFPMADREQRCCCGQLLAVVSAEGIEIKCRRCKAVRTIPMDAVAPFFKDKEPLSSDPTGRRTVPNRESVPAIR